MKLRTIVGLAAASIAASVVVVAAAADADGKYCANGIWPRIACDNEGNPTPELTEWFTDIPWRQKLGTYTGNKIDVAIVLPYDVLRPNAKTACSTAVPPLTEEQCMIEIGVTNIVGTHRIDTKYDPDDPSIKDAKIGDTPYCQDRTLPCIEVKLEVSNWWAQPSDSTLPPGVNTLNKQLFGNERDPVNYPSGFVLTDASVYAPQMPWYMSHYCDSRWNGDSQDPVCYGDYLSPMNSAFNGNGAGGWPGGAAFSVHPSGPPPAPSNHCMEGLDKCSIALAAFALTPVPSNPKELQYQPWNDYLIRWFNRALTAFPEQVTEAERQRHFAWTTKTVGWEDFVYPQALHNPFQGAFVHTARPANSCDISFDGNNGCDNTGNQFAKQFIYPRQCSLYDLSGAATGDLAKVAKLRNCSLAFETHPNGFKWQWSDPDGKGPDYGADFVAASMKGNQYGRTSFFFAGVPGMQLPVTFLKDQKVEGDLSIYEKVYNASIFSMYLPVANVADLKNAMQGRNYKSTEFYHTLLMSNHNESDPWQFADGIRGKVLWHNEYRMEGMYDVSRASPDKGVFRDRMFAASFKPADAKAPFHNETCDGCHVRNGSGIPINTEGKLDLLLREFMKDGPYVPSVGPNGTTKKDYTFTGEIRPMKLVFFDLHRNTSTLDSSRYSEPLATPEALAPIRRGRVQESEDKLYYNNKVMNYFGDSFHVTTPGNKYAWTYVDIKAGSERLVVKDERRNQGLIDPKTGLPKVYKPVEIRLDAFQTGPCQILLPAPTRKPWPANCSEVDGAAITAAINTGEMGYMHLNGKRLGNLSAMEAIPSSAIIGFEEAQKAQLGAGLAGELIWTAGSRDGYKGDVHRVCTSKSIDNCFIGRFGWIGDRASLEDQVANAAFVEMNMTTKQGYDYLYPQRGEAFPIRYGHPNCGPANKKCLESKGNADLTERDVERMADYARWLGNPTRSEFKVALHEVIQGEKVFRKLGCDTCHVIRKIEIVPKETMLTKEFRARLETRIKGATANDPKTVPFLSYIGTDLLMHDMGYLSQVADAPPKVQIRENGVVKPNYRNYVQKIRTPALKGLGLNRFVTDSYRNTKTWKDDDNSTLDAACDFLLHDGRACDAIEAAFLHDGPAVDKLRMIPNLNALPAEEVGYLRAFLYSL